MQETKYPTVNERYTPETQTYEYGTCFHASYSKLGSKLTLQTFDTHTLLYELFLDN